MLLCGIFIMACKTSSILDYSTIENEMFFKEYDLENKEFDKFRMKKFLFLTSIIRPNYDSYRLYLSIYSVDNKACDLFIERVEIKNENQEVIFESKNIKNMNNPESTKNELFVTYLTLIDNIPQEKLPKGNYTVELHFDSFDFIYNFFPKEKKYLVMP